MAETADGEVSPSHAAEMLLRSLDPLRLIQSTQGGFQKASFPMHRSEFFALELAGEVGELANLEKKVWRNREPIPTTEIMAAEAADVFVALLNYCNAKNIDLTEAVRDKIVMLAGRAPLGVRRAPTARQPKS